MRAVHIRVGHADNSVVANFRNVEIRLLGLYQPINCSNVLEAISILTTRGFYITHPHVMEGLKKAEWHARFERISDAPLVIFDGAHNPEGIVASVDSIKSYFGSSKIYALTGVMADKDYTFMASKICEIADKIFCLTPDNPRALNAEEYAQVFRSLGKEAIAFKNVKEATQCAIFEAKRNGKALLCLGSLYMYGEVLKEIEKLNS